MDRLMRKGTRERASEEIELVELTVKLNGIILKKAEFAGFEKVYSKVFERMIEFEIEPETFGSEQLLEILGEVGG